MQTHLDSHGQKLHFKLPSTFDILEQVVEETEAFMQKICDDEDLVYRIVLLTSEAVTNAIEHGNKLDASKEVVINLEAHSDRFELSVQDEGVGFEAEQIPDPLSSDNLLEGRGRGLFFMDQMADQVLRELDGRVLRLVFHR